MKDKKIGFIGLGNMGKPMAMNILKSGYRLSVSDKNEETLSFFLKKEIPCYKDSLDLANNTEIIFLSLPTPEIVLNVVNDIKYGEKLKRVIDLSTIGPNYADKAFSLLSEKGIEYIDSPVSGGITGAEKATLAVMTSCKKESFEEVEELLSKIGKTFYVGDKSGQAQTLKIANNIMSAAAVAITSEALVMGVKAGLDPKIMLEVINSGSGRNTASADKFPRCVLPRTFDVGFSAALAYKDVKLCVDEAESIGCPMIVGSAVRDVLSITNAKFGRDADFSDVARVFEEWANVEIK